MNLLLFSYGTLQKEDVQLKLFGRHLVGETDSLPGYRLADIQVVDEVFLAKGESRAQKTLIYTGKEIDTVTGTAFELSEAEILMADKYEPANYSRKLVVLSSGKQAWIYLCSG